MGTLLCCPDARKPKEGDETYEPFEPDEIVHGENFWQEKFLASKSKEYPPPSGSELEDTYSDQTGTYRPPSVHDVIAGTPIIASAKRTHSKRNARRKRHKKRKSKSKKRRKHRTASAPARDSGASYHTVSMQNQQSGDTVDLDGDIAHVKYATYPPDASSNHSEAARLHKLLQPDNPSLIGELMDLERTERVKSLSSQRPPKIIQKINPTLLQQPSESVSREEPASVRPTDYRASKYAKSRSVGTNLGSRDVPLPAKWIRPVDSGISVGSDATPAGNALGAAAVSASEEEPAGSLKEPVGTLVPSHTPVTTSLAGMIDQPANPSLPHGGAQRLPLQVSESFHRQGEGQLEEFYELEVEPSLPWLTQLVREEEPDARPRMSAIMETGLSRGNSTKLP